MSVSAASATATFTADEIVVETALGGGFFRLAAFNKAINLATTGAGGMDTGSAPTNGYVALYAIYNPTTGDSALLARNATSAVQPNVYGGANMPAGYTASALVSVWGVNGSGQFNTGYQIDRQIYSFVTNALNTTTLAGSFTSFTFTNVPLNAKTVSGNATATNSASNNTPQAALAASATGLAEQDFSATAVIAGGGIQVPFSGIPLITPQTLYYKLATVSSGTPNFAVNVTGYSI
ncbi:phage tail protein [Burkholderia sp. Se-20373]|nr:phage tail protein [Burkholderia sp. Se-20373]